MLPVPFVVNTAGWVLTENGRQPWIVQGLMRTGTPRRPRWARRPS
ncbi:MAG TPA: cytochrome ubiquinol oxidase subunit I [Pseudonocardia sp.]|nr:cytochrome ubiquinol oxidase subunit I [Pseudonocardia sp.]